eukprot:scaffold3504_cov240-Pinguiococcus_pyrenoidosus.AAC.49
MQKPPLFLSVANECQNDVLAIALSLRRCACNELCGRTRPRAHRSALEIEFEVEEDWAVRTGPMGSASAV